MQVMKKFNLILVSLLLIFTTFSVACKPKKQQGALPDVGVTAPSLPSETPPTVEEEIPVLPELPDNSGDDTQKEPEIETSNAKYLRSTVNGLSVRSGAGTGYKKLGYIDKGDMLSLVEKNGGWYKTVYKEKTAYVSANYVTKVSIPRSSDSVEKVIATGERLMGYPYVYGSQRYHWGNGVLNSAFVDGEYDCSALMQYMFYKGAGVLLDVTSRLQSTQGTAVTRLQRGDVMFFTNAYGQNKTGVERVRHVGLYLGGNYILHTASDYAVIEEISSARWNYFLFAKRMA